MVGVLAAFGSLSARGWTELRTCVCFTGKDYSLAGQSGCG